MRRNSRIQLAVSLSMSAVMLGGIALAEQGSARELVATWPSDSQAVAQDMIAKLGRPETVTDTALIWTVNDKQAFLEIERAATRAEETRYAETGTSRDAGAQ